MWLVAGTIQAQLTTLVTGPETALPAGGDCVLRLRFLNDGPAPVNAAFPERLRGWFRHDAEKWPATFTFRGPNRPETTVIPPREHRHATYAGELPASVRGEVSIELESVSAGPIRVTVARPQLEPLAGAAKEGAPPARAVPVRRPTGSFFSRHFGAYQPVYFVAGPDSPTTKFQFSFKYQFFAPGGPWVEDHPWLEGFHFAYTQTSLWDIGAPSAPFFDSSYRPEGFFALRDVWAGRVPGVRELDLQAGIQHESNGKDAPDSRSLNILYFEPTLRFGDPGRFYARLAPRVWTYIGGLSDNPDLADFRGYADLKLVLGWNDIAQLTTVGRVGNDWNRGSVQFDLAIPLRKWFFQNVDFCLHAQYFLGYGESLLRYNERESLLRFGISLIP
jgi:outer membrane phospholipase A